MRKKMAVNNPGIKMSLFGYLRNDVTRGYVLENDEERYTHRREKMYTFMKIPRELEKFMSYGFFHCLDSFLFAFTFSPIRFGLALLALVFRAPLYLLGLVRPYQGQGGRLLLPAEIIDLLKGLIIGVCVYVMSFIDTSMIYHLIKSQSVIKLYLFYNMLEVGDRLFSAFGQDTIDALFWTATEPRGRKRELHMGVIPHFVLTTAYVILHTLLVLLQATTLNVAINASNASNKALLTIMMSNNFVEIKGSVFKKFDKNNLFQVSCSDVRERFHLFSLLFIVVVQTMKEYGWREESFWNLAPDCLLVLGAEFLVDWIKHAFITRFNEVSAEVYKEYTTFLAYDLAQTKQKHAFSDHSDIVSRRMGFIPLPLAVVMVRVIGTAVKGGNTKGAIAIFILAYLCLVTLRILASIVILGKACDLIDQHQSQKRSSSSSPKKESVEPKQKAEEESTLDEVQGDPFDSPSPAEDVRSDLALLESKLQAIDPDTPPPAIVADQVEDSANLSTIAEDSPVHSRLQIIQSHNLSNSSEAQTSSSASPGSKTTESSGTSNISSTWNNRRSRLMNTKHQGELNKVVFSDSRRRPLSCTPPSTSLSTSLSIDDEDVDTFVNKQLTSGSAVGQDGQQEQQCNSEAKDESTVKPKDLKEENVPLMRQKALSSPDFMKSCRGPYNAELDWPDPEEPNKDDDIEDFVSDASQAEDKSKIVRRKRFETYHESFEN